MGGCSKGSGGGPALGLPGLALGVVRLIGLIWLIGCGSQAAQSCTVPSAKAATAPTVTFGQGSAQNQMAARTAKITATFSEPMKKETLTGATVVLAKCSGPGGSCSQSTKVAGAVTYDDCTAAVTFTPDGLAGLEPTATFQMAIAACGSTTETACPTDTTLPRDLESLPLASNRSSASCPSVMPTCVASFPFTTEAT